MLSIHSSTAEREIPPLLNHSEIDLHSSVAGTIMNSSTRQSHIVVTMSDTTPETPETLLAVVLKESPVARNLQHRKKSI